MPKVNGAKTRIRPSVAPFHVRNSASTCKRAYFYGPWEPDPVILFGPKGEAASIGLSKLNHWIRAPRRRGWYVVDTPGFEEPHNIERERSVLAKREKKLRRHVKRSQEKHSHFLHEVMKHITDQFETQFLEFLDVNSSSIEHEEVPNRHSQLICPVFLHANLKRVPN